MDKFFNTTGPCIEAMHYMLPAAPRLATLKRHVARGQYVVVHAPRQCGKSTSLQAIAEDITREGRYAALYFSCEAGAAWPNDPEGAQQQVLGSIVQAAQQQLPSGLQPPANFTDAPAPSLTNALDQWAQACPKPLVLFFDEIDALRGESLNAVLRQLRAGFINRPRHAPWSVVLCGLRDVRDYKAASGGDPQRLGTSSPFNIKVKSLTMPMFTADEVGTLYRQHTEATGQAFSEDAVAKAFDLTQGQPWLVNSLAAEIIDEMEIDGPISIEHVETAKERLILTRATHLDSLVARLHEEPVRRVLEPLISSGAPQTSSDITYDDDVRYVTDLGLIARDAPVRPANPIYQEVMVRALTANYTPRINAEPARFVGADGRFDMQGALQAFVEFWMEHGEAMARPGQTYPEATAQIVMMAFLQRVVNGGGFIDREYGVGRGRIDLLVRWPYESPEGRQVQREVIELKRWATGDRHGDPLHRGLEQIDDYLARTGVDHGWLVIFDMRDDAADVYERTRFEQHTSPSGKPIMVLRA
ncbi:MAG: AAA family ATPase [Bradymonadia bacterium]